MQVEPVPVLDAYAATQCPRRIHNTFDSTIPRSLENLEQTAEQRGRIAAGQAHKRRILTDLLEHHSGSAIDLTEVPFPAGGRSAATVEAMAVGLAVIIGGELTDHGTARSGDDAQREGSIRRIGRPDVLVRCADKGPGRPTYVPVDVKHHRVLGPNRGDAEPACVSNLAQPTVADSYRLVDSSGRRQERDALQLVHYWQMLDTLGYAPERAPVGGVIGSDNTSNGPLILWHDLQQPLYRTYSSTEPSGQALRSAQERYNYEFGFRVEVAEVALSRRDQPNDPPPLVRPIIVKECDSCTWFDYCQAELDDNDASANVGRLSAREWKCLADLGVQTVHDLATLDAATISQWPSDDGVAAPPPALADAHTTEILTSYLANVRHLQDPLRRLADAVTTAQMVKSGTYLKRITSGPLDIPQADIEIDFDIENDREGRVYLWGMLITDTATGKSSFRHHTSWDVLDAATEAHLAGKFWRDFTDLLQSAAERGQTVKVFHYANPEPGNLRRIAADHPNGPLPELAEVNNVIRSTFVDLYPVMRRHFFGRSGLGLKVTATRGAGFSWRDEDPGGLQSITWLEQVRAGDSELQRRILEYNEDDVRATLALRRWLRTQ